MRKVLVVIMAVFFAFACNVNEDICKVNFNYLYKQSIVDNAPVFIPYFVDDTTCRIYYKIPPGTLSYKKDETTNEYIANFQLGFKMFESYKARNILDSSIFYVSDTNKLQQPKRIVDSIDLKKPKLEKAILKAFFLDKNQLSKIEDVISINTKPGSRYYFKRLNKAGEVIFDKYIYEEAFELKTSIGAERLYVAYYNREFPIAKPPFTLNEMVPFDYRPDSVFAIELEKGESGTIILEQEGFYHFQVDTAGKEGLTIFKFYEGFPEIVSTKQMLEPLRYICTSKEFKALIANPNLKKAIDEFWIGLAGNPVRAKSKILEYYKRVEEANILFSSYTEGWRTDKGMIYIIFGMPRAVFKDVEVEEWVYGEAFHPKAINLYFVKVINPFTDYDYYLTRSKSYKDPWYMAVDRIRR